MVSPLLHIIAPNPPHPRQRPRTDHHRPRNRLPPPRRAEPPPLAHEVRERYRIRQIRQLIERRIIDIVRCVQTHECLDQGPGAEGA